MPVDYANPEGAQAQLAVIRVPATGDRIGVLMVNPGGPGASAVDTVAGMGAALADTEIVAGSTWSASTRAASGTPRPNCAAAPTPSSTPTDANRWPTTAPPASRTSNSSTASSRSAASTGWARNFWRTSAPRPSARDMDVVRAALGENQINYLGFSYGTELGAAYAERFGDRVRAMVLDGAVDPSLDPIDETIRQMAGFQTAFDAYAADCAQSAGCPLGTDPAQFVNRYHQLVDPLVQRPAMTSDPRGLSYQDAITGTVNALYTQRYWRYLTSGLLGLQRGTDAGDLLLLADDYQNRDASGHYPNQQDAFNAIRCVDSPFPDRPGGVGRRRPTDPRGGAVPELWHLHRLCAARCVRDVAGAADVVAAPGGLTRARQGRRGVHHARPGHSVSGRSRPGPADGRGADHLRRHPAHGGVQRRRLRRHRGGELLDRLGASRPLVCAARH